MQMKDRHRVEGTEPPIYIGRRISRRQDGSVSVSRTYHAEWTLESRQRSKSLGTTNRAAAIRAAHALSEQLRNGMEVKPIEKASVAEIRDAYLAAQETKGRAPKTVDKYRHDLTEFTNWWEQRDGRL